MQPDKSPFVPVNCTVETENRVSGMTFMQPWDSGAMQITHSSSEFRTARPNHGFGGLPSDVVFIGRLSSVFESMPIQKSPKSYPVPFCASGGSLEVAFLAISSLAFHQSVGVARAKDP